MKKRCGGCKYFVKVDGFGICDLFDWRCKEDYNCAHWKAPKYKREDKNELKRIY